MAIKKLIVEQLVGIKPAYTVKDPEENILFRIKGGLDPATKSLTVYDMDGNEVIGFKKELASRPEVWYLSKEGKNIERIRRKALVGFTFLFDAHHWVAQGAAASRTFGVYKDGKKIAMVIKKLTWDRYEIEYLSDEDVPYLIGLTLALETMMGVFKSGNGA